MTTCCSAGPKGTAVRCRSLLPAERDSNVGSTVGDVGVGLATGVARGESAPLLSGGGDKAELQLTKLAAINPLSNKRIHWHLIVLAASSLLSVAPAASPSAPMYPTRSVCNVKRLTRLINQTGAISAHCLHLRRRTHTQGSARCYNSSVYAKLIQVDWIMRSDQPSPSTTRRLLTVLFIGQELAYIRPDWL